MEAEISLVAIEALIFASEEPVSVAQLRRVVLLTPSQIAGAVEQINADLEKSGRPYEIVEVAGGYRFRTRPQYGELIASAQPERRARLSRPALDCLAVIAYRQPISRPEIEELRSVDCGAVLRSLLDRGLVRIVGRRDAPGRPALYATSAGFLEIFGLRSLQDLPDLRELLTPPAAEGNPVAEAIAEGEARADAETPAEPPVEDADSAALAPDVDEGSSGEPDGEPEPERDLEDILGELAEAIDEAEAASAERSAASEAPAEPEPLAEAALDAARDAGGSQAEESRDVASVGEPPSAEDGGSERATPESVG